MDLERLGLAAFLLDEEGRLRACNHLFAELINCPADKLVGSMWRDTGLWLVDEEGEPLPTEQFPRDCRGAEIRDGRLHHCVCTVALRKANCDGEYSRWFRLTLHSQHAGHAGAGSGGSVLLGQLTDVSDFFSDKRTHRQVFRAKTEWETTVDAIQDIVTILDLDMRIIRANKAAHDLFGYRFGQLKSRPCFEIFHHRSEPCPGCSVAQTVVDGQPHSSTVYNSAVDLTFSVSSFPILGPDGKMHQLVHVARDVTGYLRNEMEKNRLMAAIEQASESVMIAGPDGEILYVNPAFERGSGYSRAEAIGNKISILKSGMHDERFYTSMWQTLSRGKVWRGRLVNRRKDGVLFKEDAAISPVFDAAGSIVNYVALKRDVTREEQLEQQLNQANKMEALGTLAGGIAHDFNNILSAMIGYAEMAKDRLAPDNPVLEDIDQVLAAGDRAVELVAQILAFSRLDSTGRFRVFRLQHIVKEFIKLLKSTLPATIELEYNIDSGCASIYADPGQIYQVVMNLCANARQAIGERHGRISIQLNEVHPDDAPIGESEAGGSYVELVISDDGCGMSETQLERIFDPFYTTKQKEQGTGLGLAVVHTIIKHHRGEISVSSTLGEGTTFRVYFNSDGREDDIASVEQSEVRGGNERILLLDDEKPVALVVQQMLEQAGYRVQVFLSAIDAVRAFRADPDCCDLLLTDMLMPNMTGSEVAREFLSLRPELPVVMLTGHSSNIDEAKAARLGIREVLLKPIRKVTLQTVIRKVLDHG